MLPLTMTNLFKLVVLAAVMHLQAAHGADGQLLYTTRGLSSSAAVTTTRQGLRAQHQQQQHHFHSLGQGRSLHEYHGPVGNGPTGTANDARSGMESSMQSLELLPPSAKPTFALVPKKMNNPFFDVR